MLRMLMIGVMAAALTGCITRARQEQQLSEAGPKEDAFCKSIGARPGSDAYTNCRVTMRRELLQSQAQERAERAQAGEAMSVAGAALLAPRQTYNPTVTCNSNSFAGMTTTTCR